MPRRKGHGIPPTKRVKQPDAITRSAPLKNKLYNEIPIVNAKEETIQMTVNTVPIKSEPPSIISEALHSKYLHKKFKKMASTLLSEDSNNHINNVLNGSRLKSGGRVPMSPDFTEDSEKVRSSPVRSPKLEAPANNSQAISTSAGRYVCSYCKLACAKPSVLQKHIRAHTNERPYPCLPCGFAFKTKSNLYKHCRSRAHASKLEESGEKMNVVFDGDEVGSSEDDDNLSNISYSTSLSSRIEMELEGKDEIPKSIYKPKYRFMEQPLISSFCEKSDDRKENAKSPPRLHLKIPVPNMTPLVSTPSPFTSGSSPSPELLHRHINKLISENQAIVETNDPFWSKKFMQRTNSSDNSCSSPLSTSPSSSPMIKKSVKLTMNDSPEDVNGDKSAPKHSKLALALLRPQTSTSPKFSNTSPITETSDPQPLNLSTNNKEESLTIQSRKRSYSEGVPERSPKLLKEKVNSVPLKLHNHSAQDIKRYVPSLSEKNSSVLLNHLDAKKDLINNTKNPEGSIIKDLLLKARASGSTLIVGTTVVNAALDNSPLESLTPPVCDDRAFSPSSQFMCHLCKEPVSYQNSENLEIHQLYHCKGNDASSRSSLSPSPHADIHYESPSYRKSGRKEGTLIMVPSHPSPGPLLGSTPLIESNQLKSPHCPVSNTTLLKKRKLDTEAVETRVISATTLRSLEELSKSPMRTNLQMFGGEVKILDTTGGETKTLRIEPSNRTSSKNSLDTPLQVLYQGKNVSKDNNIDLQDCSSMLVTIAKQGFHAGGSFLQVPHKTLSEQLSSRQLSSSRSTVPLSPAPNLPGYQEPSKLLIPICPNPGTSNISFTGISTPVQLPFKPFTSILADSTVINPLTNITAYNPLTLPPASMLQPISQGGIPSMYSSGVVSILDGGKEIPYVPGMPGPHSILPNNSLQILTPLVESDTKFNKVPESKANNQQELFSRSFKHEKLHSVNKKPSTLNIPKIQVNSEMIESPGEGNSNNVNMRSVEENSTQALSSTIKRGINKRSPLFSLPSDSEDSEDTTPEKKFLRPTSLPLKPGTFVPKRQPLTPVLSLVSPETPRPRKSFGQLYLNGHAYTYLGLKCSTRMFFCTLNKPQPIYVPLSPEHNKVSMYSNWKVCSEADPNPLGLEPARAIALYDSRHRPSAYTLAQTRNCQVVTHSSYWTSRSQHSSKDDSCETAPKRVKIFAGGFESNEDYIYVRGRGRGRYVCEECGIRCKKPSMLKKHIRTHTDVRPFTCNHCKFSFKTKGNLTKHMKSKAHYKTCLTHGLDPVPTLVDDSCVDEDALARQQALRETHGLEPTESEEDEEDEEDGDTDDDEEDEEDEVEQEGDMEGEDWQAARSLLTLSETIQSAKQRQHASAGLVSMSARPSTYPYRFTCELELSSTAQPQTPILTSISAQREREKVSQNTGLVQGEAMARDSSDESKPESAEKSVTARYYFPSSRDLGDSLRESTVAVKQSTPIDLSNKPTDKNVRACEAAMLLASLCSTMERLPMTKVAAVATENSVLLQAYLTERAVQDSRKKQHQYKHKASVVELRSGAMAPDISAAKENALGILAHTSSDIFRQPISEPQTNKPQAEFLPPSSCPSPSYVSVLEDGRSMCNICNKVFSKPSQLRLHVNIHYFERPFRCESCAVSFRTKGHLQKHQRSVSHLNKVSMNSTFGTATTTNPRPFKCDDCKIAFRIHGHLAKHLRSKMHIMKLECLGKLPFGTYAELERSGVNMNDIDTTDCENSLESLQLLAQKLYEKDPSKLGQWDPVEMMPHHALSSGDTSSEGEEDPAPHIPVAEQLPPHHSYPVQRHPSLLTANISNIQSNTSPPNLSTSNSPTIISHKGPKHKIIEGLEEKAQVSKTEMGEPVSERRTDEQSES